MATPSRAATFQGVKFDDTVQLNQTELRLNGMGMRAVLWLKGYVAGLYLSERASTPQAVFQAPGPKRIQMKMLLEVPSKEFRKALINGIRNNASPAEQAKLQDRIEQFELAIEEVGLVHKGDTITLDFVPERGLTLRLNNQPKGTTIAGADFFNAVLAIFIGNAPVDPKLKSGLLGNPA